jgi:hypothetical protein
MTKETKPVEDAPKPFVAEEQKGVLRPAYQNDAIAAQKDGDPSPTAFLDPDADPKGHVTAQLNSWGKSQEPISWAPTHLQPLISAIRAANSGFGQESTVQALLDQTYPGDEIKSGDVVTLSTETDGGTINTAFSDIDPQYLGDPVYANEEGLVSKDGTFTPSAPDPAPDPPASRGLTTANAPKR